MSELDPRSLWQQQPLDAVPLEPDRASRAPQLDFAVPTAVFGAARPRVKVWRVVAVSCAVAATVAVIIGIAARPPPPRPEPVSSGDDLMAECRVKAGPAGPSPDWDRATDACDRLLAREPGRQEAFTERAHLTVLRACEADFNRARALTTQRREEEALGAYERLTHECEAYFVEAQEPARALALAVRRRAGHDCLEYAGAKQWREALPHCQLAAHLACQSDPTDPGGRLEIKALLEARTVLLPDAPPWRCDQVPVLYRPPPPADPAVLAQAELSQRKPAPELGRALVSYFRGDFHSATVPLQRLLETPERAQHHEAARALLSDLEQVINVYERGTRELDEGRFERSAELFRQALALDERLMLGAEAAGLDAEQRREAMQGRVSYLRKAIADSSSSQAYLQGKRLADQQDFLGACRSWKLGLLFSRNIDLLKAVTNVCTPRAAAALERAQTCAEFAAVLDYAVDGDGFAEKSVEAGEARGCPPP